MITFNDAVMVTGGVQIQQMLFGFLQIFGEEIFLSTLLHDAIFRIDYFILSAVQLIQSRHMR